MITSKGKQGEVFFLLCNTFLNCHSKGHNQGVKKLTIVIKKNGIEEKWNSHKIVEAIQKSNARVKDKYKKLTNEQILSVILYVESKLKDTEKINTSELHNVVIEALSVYNPNVCLEYKAFRNYKERFRKSFQNAAEHSNKIVYDGDKENANKDSTLNSTKQALISETLMREMMIQFELKPEWVKAHEEGWIHIHDLSSRYLNQINCCLFDMGNLLNNGFEMNGSKYLEPKTVQTAWAVVGDVTLSASSQQYGGFTIPEIDTVLAKYAERSYNKHLNYLIENKIEKNKAGKMAEEMTIREIEQGYQGFETKLNTVSNSLGQIPFVTITFGLDTNKWARIISSIILKIRKEGMGKNRMTAIFPKLVFIYRKEVNGKKDSPNYDLYKQAIECSRIRLYPDYLSLDNPETNNLAVVYERSGKVVSGMGCRAYLSPFYHPETGEEIYTGRNNLGAITLNLPKYAIESKGDLNKFYQLIDKYAQMVFEIHLDAYKKIAKSKGSTNPLMFCEGGSWMSVGYNESIEPIIKASTMSLGYIGLEEVVQYFFRESLKHHNKFALDVVKHLKELVNQASKKYDKLFALYSTPAESLIYRFQKMNRKQYGRIKNVTDRKYMTNSFHLHVTEDVSVPEKIYLESPFHGVATGGRISYCEFPYGVDFNVLKQSIDYAMQKGLYFGVNVISATCCSCGYQGDFEVCPKCGSDNVTSVSRVCGYLSFGKIKGDSRYNLGKQAEIRDRIKHRTNEFKELYKYDKEYRNGETASN